MYMYEGGRSFVIEKVFVIIGIVHTYTLCAGVMRVLLVGVK